MKKNIVKSAGIAAMSVAFAAACLLPVSAQTTAAPAAISTTPTTSTAPTGPHHFRGGFSRGGPLAQVVRGLHLTAAQRSEIEPILKAQEPQVKAIEEQARTQMATVVTNVKAQILPYLTAQQQQILANRAQFQAAHAAHQH